MKICYYLNQKQFTDNKLVNPETVFGLGNRIFLPRRLLTHAKNPLKHRANKWVVVNRNKSLGTDGYAAAELPR